VLQPGNVTDVCAIMQYREKKNLIELGYNPTFFTNQAVLLPAQTVRNSNFVRNSFYVNLSHLFKESLLLKKPGALTAGFSIARSEAEAFNAKITVIWIGVTLLF
jgi:hypothetical protein